MDETLKEFIYHKNGWSKPMTDEERKIFVKVEIKISTAKR